MMECSRYSLKKTIRLLAAMVFVLPMAPAMCQVSPTEILNPQSRAAEQEYFSQLKSLQSSIAETKFPFPFKLARYLNAKPNERASLDLNGIEFVYFQQSVVLKISGLYKAAFNSTQLSENQRASRTFQDAIVPILRLVSEKIPHSAACDGIGFEVIYNSRHLDGDYDYEGREVLTIVFSRDDAFNYVSAAKQEERQQILNRTHVFVNGKEYGLALGQREPLNVQAFERPALQQAIQRVSFNATKAAPPLVVSGPPLPAAASSERSTASPTIPTAILDAVRLQTQFQAKLDAIAQEDGAKFHLVPDMAPSFENEGDQTRLHLTMQNTSIFAKKTTSIYRRAAQSFDLFLAPEMKELSATFPVDGGYDTVVFSVSNAFEESESSRETIDYICPLNSVHSFVQNKISTQDLINQSIVLVNGMRISVNLQLVE